MKTIIYTLLLSLTLQFSATAQSTVQNGATCPDFTTTDTDGNTHNLYTYCNQGKYVVIDFFAYWCGPCMATAPYIEELYKKYGCNEGDIIVIGNECDALGDLSTLESYDQQAGLDPVNSYPSWPGNSGGSDLGTLYGISAYPTIVLIGPDKKMINHDIWPISSVQTLENAFPGTANLTPMSCALAGINENSLVIDFKMYPNPANSEITIEAENIVGINIIDIAGKTVISQDVNNFNKQTISLDGLSSGMYTMEVKSQTGGAKSKFVKK